MNSRTIGRGALPIPPTAAMASRAARLIEENDHLRRRIEALQWQLLVPGLCQPVWRRFVAVAQATGALPPGAIGAEWTAPRFEAVDPLKDIQADILAVRAGLMTLKEAIARQGYDPASVLPEIATTNAELDQLGITLDTDPRKATRTGAAKPVDEPDDKQETSDD